MRSCWPAGLERLGAPTRAPGALPEPVPVGQGCLLLEARAGDRALAKAIAALTDHDSLLALTAERALVTALDATCHTPIGACRARG